MIVALVLVILAVAAVVGWLRLERHGHSNVPAEHWQRTEEIFRDPSSGRLTRVWVDPLDNSRHYVPDNDLPGRMA